ncbi:MAG: hypothetical protein UX39_C0015G0001 [Candidatus Magasanikbacteria bacterium GW2011_GWA2_46_17]|uniref:Uncharacterized protein n=1 Tax=Candidatus Magasanikbacteria bacterium GW2011_GWA2_46_17 TaxID=1619042 RepID=A0A0G1R770_9BACT|nr:MAG: hypothetical protein UX39_C0015G0001 [Candidatus Magasanikbacteria bacterium GW2011_GWA2_46_17]
MRNITINTADGSFTGIARVSNGEKFSAAIAIGGFEPSFGVAYALKASANGNSFVAVKPDDLISDGVTTIRIESCRKS